MKQFSNGVKRIGTIFQITDFFRRTTSKTPAYTPYHHRKNIPCPMKKIPCPEYCEGFISSILRRENNKLHCSIGTFSVMEADCDALQGAIGFRP